MSYTKYYVYKEKISTDGGASWTYTGNEVPSGDPIGQYSTLEECEASLYKLVAEHSDGYTLEVNCDDNPVLSRSDVTGHNYTKITSAVIGECVTSTADDCTFEYCTSLTSVTLSNSLTRIGQGAFGHCTSLRSITIPSSVRSIGWGSFTNCTSLTSIAIPNGVTTIGEYTFHECTSLTGVSLPNSVTSFGVSSFSNCTSLTGITIPTGVTSIDGGAFYYCTSLTSVTIPNSITTIGAGAFAYCGSLTSIAILATTPPTLSDAVFYNTNNCPIYVPSASVSAYQAAFGEYANRIQSL